MGKVTEYGYVRKSLQEILASMKDRVKSKLGADWNVETGSIEDQFISVFAEEADQIEQGIEGVINSQTLNGAEGIFLDDILSKQGVYRQGKTAGGGAAIVSADISVIPFGTTVSSGFTASATNNIAYTSLNGITFDSYMSCYRLPTTSLTIGTTYTFSIYNVNTPNTNSFVRQVTTEVDKDRALIELAQYINANVTDKPSDAYFDSATRTLYIGYNQANNLPNPFYDQQLYVAVTPRVGFAGNRVNMIANTEGFYPLRANGLLGVSPSFAGYHSIINWQDFNSGSDVQTDAEYFRTYQTKPTSEVKGSPSALKNALLNIDGVVDAEIFENPTTAYIYDTSNNTVCNPFTYNVAVLGGNDFEVATVIYKYGYGNTKRYGTYSTTIQNDRGEAIIVDYTRVGYFDVGVEVKYRTKDNSLLSESENLAIIESLQEVANTSRIGDYVSVQLLTSVAYASLKKGKVKEIQIRIRDLTLPSPVYTSQDLLADYDEKPRILAQNVVINRL